MLHYSSVYLFIAVIAALFGICAMAVGAADFAAVLFMVFIALLIGSIAGTLFSRRGATMADGIDDPYPGPDEPGTAATRE